ncbi:MAG TPA: hypothetical protein VFL68_15745 [Pseudolabrys sp.]|jgi:hypothetical protein|nr:hypothetical protein [Pseudolabrys sp.]
MRPNGGCFRFAGTVAHRRWLRPLSALAVVFLLLVVPSGARAQGPSTSKSTAHVYLLRGVLNVFSMGMDQIAYKLEQRGIATTVTNYLLWSSVADDAAAAYKSGKVRTIILVGHSSGATALPDMVDRLTRLGAPVKLAIGLDSVFQTTLSGKVGRYINFYIGNGAGTRVARGKNLQGELSNVDVENIPGGVGHVTIDKNEIIQQKVISAILSSL